MFKRTRAAGLSVLVCAALVGCNGDTVAPRATAGTPGGRNDDAKVPGSVGSAITQGGMHGCIPRAAQIGTATIGPSGGELDAGPHRLIIPPGALTKTVQMSATVPESETPTIIFEPHGLQFKKPAGLILDASNCFDVPPIVYINELGVAGPPIFAIYSTWWHTIAAPIDHFSGYAVAF